MNPLVECCEQNLAKGGAEVFDRELSEQVDLVTYSCLSECDTCAIHFFTLFEGEMIKADSPEALKARITEQLKEWEI